MEIPYAIREYPLQQGALEIAYIEEYFNDFPTRKSATDIVGRLTDRECQILMTEAPLEEDPGTVVPVSYKVSHELRETEADPKLADLVTRLQGVIEFTGRKILYNWLARRGSTGAARATSARSPRSRKFGPCIRATTRSSSRPRTATSACAARSTASSST